MSTRIVFDDHNDNEMEVFLTKEKYIFIGLKADWVDGYIELDKEGMVKLIDLLQTLEKEM